MKFDLTSLDTYSDSSLKLIKNRLIDFYGKERISTLTLEDIKKDIKRLNAYEGIEHMKEVDHKEIFVIEDGIDTKNAENAILEGKVFWEHAAAGEATRLGIGTKYCIMMSDLTFDKIREMLIHEARKDGKTAAEIEKISKISDETLRKECSCSPGDLLPMTLGIRHMLQLVYDIREIASKHKKDPTHVIKKQKVLIILNEKTSKQISEELLCLNFLGLDPDNVLFMEQSSFHGIKIDNGTLFYHKQDENDNKCQNRRLHNHGQMVMQKLHDNIIFRFVKGKKKYISRQQYFNIIKPCDDMISYNIEDISYLTNSIDLQSLATALTLKDKGYHMVMEVVGQNPKKPQKGASLFFDEKVNKNVMIESFRMYNIKEEDIKLMNKNFNHYPNPLASLKKMMKHGLPLGFEVKEADNGEEYIYLCPVQGDMNFIVNTAFVTRKKLEPIKNWKTAAQSTQTINAMWHQDRQKGFKELAEDLGLLSRRKMGVQK